LASRKSKFSIEHIPSMWMIELEHETDGEMEVVKMRKVNKMEVVKMRKVNKMEVVKMRKVNKMKWSKCAKSIF
jgi:hypothetical protein